MPLHEIFSDPRAMRYWDRPPHSDLTQSQQFLENFMAPDRATSEEYIVERNGVCIGKAGMWMKPEIGYILHPDHWGQGYVTEALRAILPGCWARFDDMVRITAELDPRNTGSVRVLERLGFTQTHTVRQNFRYGDVEWCDSAYYELRRADAGEA